MYLDQWGPIAWELFHYITYSYKPELHNYYIIFFYTLYSIIPCPYCQKDIKNTLLEDKNLPILNIPNKNKLIEWFIKIHNIVNEKTNNKNRFDLKMANEKYLKDDNLTIDNARIFKFLELSYNSQINKNNPDIVRNLIALAHIYPSSIEKVNLKLILGLRNINDLKNKKWLEILKDSIISPKLSNINLIKYNNNQFNINLKKVIFQDKKDFINNNLLKSIGNSLLFVFKNNNTMNVIYTYKVIETTDIIIGIKGKSFGGSLNIIIKFNNYKKNFELNNQLVIREKNIKKDSIIAILIQSKNNTKGHKHIIESIDVI